MRFGMYVKTDMRVLPTIYIAAEGGSIVRVSSDMAGDGDIVCTLDCANTDKFTVETEEERKECEEQLALLKQTSQELIEYFQGERQSFTVPVRAEGTDFQRRVWEALCRIPYGETRTYGEIARQVGSPKGARAVGMACNRNPIMMLVPCHRVVGSDGKLVGFAGGLAMKEALLRMESQKTSRLHTI